LFIDNVLVRRENFAPYNWGLDSQPDTILQNLAVGDYTFTIRATDNEGNEEEKSIAISVISAAINPAINQIGFQNAVQVYPNPTRGNLSIDVSAMLSNVPMQVQVIDASGKVLHTAIYDTISEIPMRLEGYQSGIYLSSNKVKV